MPFIAVCPHCRNCRLRAPRAKRGQSVRCPKCKEWFELVPCEPPGSDDDSPSTSPPPTTQASPPTVHASDDSSLTPDYLSLGCVGVAFLLSQLPYGRAVAVLALLFGAGVAIQALLDGERWRRGWLGLVVNVLMLAIVVGYPGTLGIPCWWPAAAAPAPASAQFPDYIDAGDAAWQQGGVRVSLTFATISTDPATSPHTGRKDPLLWIGVKLTYVGVGSQLEFGGWTDSGEHRPTLSTADGAELKMRRAPNPAKKTVLQPGQSYEGLIAFEPPPAGQDLLLHLPAQPFGDPSLIRFRVPHDLIGRR
jgi:hypothetical protein